MPTSFCRFVAQTKAFRIVEQEFVPLKPSPFDLDDLEAKACTMKQMKLATEFFRRCNKDEANALRHALLMYDRSTSMRLYVHWNLFIETIATQGTEEQHKTWLEMARKGEIFGCFAMTELGHSSHLRGLETLARYDKASDEFLIESSGILATKWWIGGAGETATHAVVLTNLEGAGLAWFIVNLRDPKTGQLVQGVEAGHLGPKAGRNGLDSGWIRFSSVRVPRSQLLSRFLDFGSDGTIRSKPKTQHLAYNTLIGERLQALSEAASSAGQCAVIATRYALLRRQGPSNTQIIDFQVQHTTLLSILCSSIVLTSVHAVLMPTWDETIPKAAAAPALAADWHSTAACLKAFWCWWSLESVEQSRRSLGGHAFSSFNAVAGIWGDSTVLTTGGGDNYVLAQQSSRYLIKTYATGRKFGSSVGYLANAKNYKTFGLSWPIETVSTATASTSEKLDLLQQLLAAWRAAIVGLIDSILLAHGADQDWNHQMNECIKLACLHAFQLSLEVMLKKIETADRSIKDTLISVVLLSTLYHTVLEGSTFLELSVFTSSQYSKLKKQRENLARSLRKNAALLCDSLAYPDFVLKSPLGRSDGNIYEPYFEMVKAANKHAVAPYWASDVAPLFQRSKL
jgi:acyl-CoA oxidase